MEEKGVKIKESKAIEDFDFRIYNKIAEGLWPSKIAKLFNVSPQRIDYHISSLKERNLIHMNGQGNWIVINSYKSKLSKKSSRVAQLIRKKDFDTLEPDTVRGHAFQFKLEIKGLRNWTNEKRRFALQNLGIEFKELTHLFGGGQGIVFKGKKTHLTNNSVVIYDKTSYYADTGNKSHAIAVLFILRVIKSLEKALRASFSHSGRYKLRTTRNHYALIKNALAQLYNKPRRQKLEVYDGRGLWLLIDNSWNLEELELVHSETAIKDTEFVKKFFNYLKSGNDIENNFKEFDERTKKLSEQSIQLSQVMEQMNNNIIHLTKIVNDKIPKE